MTRLKTVAVALATCVLTAGVTMMTASSAKAEDYEPFTLEPGFQPNPAIGTGLSGGTHQVDCQPVESSSQETIKTYIDEANAPDHVITITAPIPHMEASVQAEGDVTLYIEGPNGTMCSNDVNGNMPAISGEWQPGTYNVWIGDFVGDGHGTYRYELKLEEQQDQQQQ